MPSRKLIGLTGPSTFTPDCMEMIESFLDANFILLYHNNPENLKKWLKECDGIILAGGVDIHPTIYHESIWNNANLSKFDLSRDVRELAIIQECLNTKKPLLGICRGHQLIGLKFGFPFVMDLSNSTICHQTMKSNITLSKNEPTHHVRLVSAEAKEIFYKTYPVDYPNPERKIIHEVLKDSNLNQDRLWVNSFHHQAISYDPKINYKDEGVTILGVARADLSKDAKEIVEFMQGTHWVSVQWHPEYDYRENSASRAILGKFKHLVDGR